MVTWCFLFCKKNIQNTYIIFLVLFFLQKILQKGFGFFQSKTNFQKMPHSTSLTLHTSRKSPVSCISSSLFSVIFFRQRSFFHKLVASFCFHGFLFVVGWKLLLLLSFLNMFKLVCCLDWFLRKMHYKIRWTLEEVKRW